LRHVPRAAYIAFLERSGEAEFGVNCMRAISHRGFEKIGRDVRHEASHAQPSRFTARWMTAMAMSNPVNRAAA
jgi:hypothetical protein